MLNVPLKTCIGSELGCQTCIFGLQIQEETRSETYNLFRLHYIGDEDYITRISQKVTLEFEISFAQGGAKRGYREGERER